MKIFDSHTHLNDEPFAGKEAAYIEHANALNVVKMTIVGSDQTFNASALALAQQYDNLYAAVGYHPDNAKDYNQKAEDLLVQQLADPKTVVLGEIGLDYYWDASPRDIQRRVFAEQLDLAHELKMPVNIHDRDALPDTYEILKNSHVADYGGVLHSFNGDPTWLKKFLNLGLNISYSGVVSFKNAKDVHASAIATPLERLMVETDAPYLTPMPYRGKQNEPGYTYYVVKAIAKLKDTSEEIVADATYQNTLDIYDIKE